MTTQEQFRAIRRAYRAARKLSPLRDDHAIFTIVAATSALRAFTGNWDCCEPQRYTAYEVVKHPRLWVKRPFVAAACTRWIAAH